MLLHCSFSFCDDWAGDYRLDVIRCPAHSPTQPHTPCLTSERDACYLYALQDVGFSYMTDPRHLKDTLFICFESDFRFYKADDLPPETWLPLAVAPSEESAPGAQPESGASRPLEASSASGSRDTPPTLMPAVQLRPDADSLGRWKSITTLPRPYKTGYSVVTDELADLVQLATVASRQGVGDLIWFGHNASQENENIKKKKQISFGSQGVMYTAQAALCLQYAISTAPTEHFDLWLKRVLHEAGQVAQPLARSSIHRSCFVWPPVGNFAAHVSMNTKKVRPGLWGEPWCVQGPPRNEARGPRTLMAFVGEGKEQQVCVLKLPERSFDLHWRTRLPPQSQSKHDADWLAILVRRNLLDPTTGEYLGPKPTEHEQSRGQAGEEAGRRPHSKGTHSVHGEAPARGAGRDPRAASGLGQPGSVPPAACHRLRLAQRRF